MADGTGEIIDSQDGVGGYADYTTTKRPIEVPDGKSERRAWLDSLEDVIAVDREIDLTRLYCLVGSKESDIHALQTHSISNRERSTSAVTIVQKQSKKRVLNAHVVLSTATTIGMTLFDLAGNAVAREP